MSGKKTREAVFSKLHPPPAANSRRGSSSFMEKTLNELSAFAKSRPKNWLQSAALPSSKRASSEHDKSYLPQRNEGESSSCNFAESESSSDSDDDLFNNFLIAQKLRDRRTSSTTVLRPPAIPDSDVEIVSVNDGSKTSESDVEVITIKDDTFMPSASNPDPRPIQTGSTLPEMEFENCELPLPVFTSPHEDPLAISTEEFETFRKHQESLKHGCHLCRRRFTSKTVLSHHIRRHKKEKPFRCEVENCEKSFVRRCDLLRHGRSFHSDKTIPGPIYRCELCDKVMKNDRNLQLHISTHYKKRHYCEICGDSFSQKGYLKIHEKMHSTGKPFVCICGDSFYKQQSLRKHFERFHNDACESSKPEGKYYTRQKRKMKIAEIESHADILLQGNKEGSYHSENDIASVSMSSEGQPKDKHAENEA